jgi:hypothetical protein
MNKNHDKCINRMAVRTDRFTDTVYNNTTDCVQVVLRYTHIASIFASNSCSTVCMNGSEFNIGTQ